jgi:hypothetical protein
LGNTNKVKEESKKMMKHAKTAIILVTMLIAATAATAVDPLGLNLPTDPVTMDIVHPGYNSYWGVTFSGIAAGYDVTNQRYPGWCADSNTPLDPGTYTAKLYSTYDTALPPYAQNANWDKITYMVNQYRAGAYPCANTQGYEIQTLIWNYIGQSYVWGPIDETCKETIKADVDANGDGFVPSGGDVATVLVDANECNAVKVDGVEQSAMVNEICVPTKQLIFVEIPFPAPELTSALAAIALVSPAFGYLLVKRKK